VDSTQRKTIKACIWVEEEEVHSQEIKTMCSSFGTKIKYKTTIGVEGSGSEFSCVWVKDAEGSYFLH
jgi:hypothetical protein